MRATAVHPRPEDDVLLRPLVQAGPGFYLFVAVLLAVFGWGIYGYVHQLREGLQVTAMREYVNWGLYITNFVFFIGISHVGALMSAILRITGAEWRKPITRMAEAITFASLFFGALMPIIDMGRPDRLLNIFRFGRIGSPILWDVICITTYLAGSTIFLFLPMIPDIALLRDRLTGVARWRRALYRALSLGWTGSARQHALLERGMFVMSIIIIPIAISVHTVVSWIFGMTLRPGWNSTIFGPYFVIGALLSGAASVIIAMAVFRKAYRLEAYITPLHFNNLALLILAMDIGYIYFTTAEYLTVVFKMETAERGVVAALFFGEYSLAFWAVQVFGLLVPALILARPRTRTIAGTVVASALIVTSMWVKRYLILVPTLLNPFLPIQKVPVEWTVYAPTWVEWSITAGSFAGFILLYTLFSRLFPIVSIWETAEVGEPAAPPRATAEGAVSPGRLRQRHAHAE